MAAAPQDSGDQAQLVAPVPTGGSARYGHVTVLTAASTLAMMLGSFGCRGRPDAMASPPPRG